MALANNGDARHHARGGARGCHHPDTGRGAVDRGRRAQHSAPLGWTHHRGGRRQSRCHRASGPRGGGRGHRRGARLRPRLSGGNDGRRRSRHRGVHGWRRRRRSAGHRQAGLQPIRSGRFDFVIGSRARGKREPGSIAWHQLAAGMLAGWGMRLLYGVRYTDMCAFRAIRRDALLELGMRELTYGWNIEMQMRAARAGLRILEIPVDYRRRSGGTSKVAGSLSGTVRAGVRIIATFVRVSHQTRPHPSSGERKLQRQPSNAP